LIHPLTDNSLAQTARNAASATLRRLIRRGRARLRLLTGTSSVYLKRLGETFTERR
jgi:hypothetical protein